VLEISPCLAKRRLLTFGQQSPCIWLVLRRGRSVFREIAAAAAVGLIAMAGPVTTSKAQTKLDDDQDTHFVPQPPADGEDILVTVGGESAGLGVTMAGRSQRVTSRAALPDRRAFKTRSATARRAPRRPGDLVPDS
jgi:hypothetical protein